MLSKRPPLPIPLQVEVYFRDGWLCHTRCIASLAMFIWELWPQFFRGFDAALEQMERKRAFLAMLPPVSQSTHEEHARVHLAASSPRCGGQSRIAFCDHTTAAVATSWLTARMFQQIHSPNVCALF
jgi:hypothetical protein